MVVDARCSTIRSTICNNGDMVRSELAPSNSPCNPKARSFAWEHGLKECYSTLVLLVSQIPEESAV